MLHFKNLDDAITERGDVRKQLEDLILQEEVLFGSFGAVSVVRTELDFADDAWHRIKNRLGVVNHQAFDPAEVDFLEFFNEPASWLG